MRYMYDMTHNPRGTHLQIADALRRGIEAGIYPRDIPAASELMKTYGISRGTANRALNILKNDGVIVSVPGLGWFVAGTVDTRPAEVRIKELITRYGLEKGNRIPGEENLAIELGISRITVRSALARLEGEGLISAASPQGRTIM
jgi:DNA-binding GntR family transcriptional regulator